LKSLADFKNLVSNWQTIITTKALVSHFNFVKQKYPNTFVSAVLDSQENPDVVKGAKMGFHGSPADTHCH